MYFSDRITLCAVTSTTDADGYPVNTNVDTAVWADVKSATRSEFYEGMKAGVAISLSFAVHVEDWGNQTQVVYGGKTYDIVRAYQKGMGVVELNCAEVVR